MAQTTAATKPIAITLIFQQPDVCQIMIDGQRITITRNNFMSVPALKAAAQRTKQATLVADQAMPYKCVGGAIIALQEAGFELVDLNWGPPAPSAN